MPNKPEQVFKVGAVRASIFRNDVAYNGKMITLPKVVLEARYRDKNGEWKGTHSFSLNEVPKAILALQKSFDYLTVIFLGRFSMRPMHFFGTIGLSCFSLGFLFSLHLTIQWLNDIAIGNRPLLLLGILLILMGIQFFTTGFVAELLVTMRQRQQDPLHSVRAVYNAAGHPPA